MKEQTVNFNLQNLKITPELFLLIIPFTFIAGNWYISAAGIIGIFSFVLFRYYRFGDHEFSVPNILPWTLIMLWGLYTFYITPDPLNAVKYYTCTILIPFIIFVLFGNLRFNDKILTYFVDAFLISGFILGAYSFYVFISYGMRADMRVPSLYYDFNIVAAYFMILFMFNLIFILRTENNYKKVFYFITIFFILLGIYLTKTRGVWVSLIISIVIFFIKKPRIIIPVIILFGLLALLFYNIIEERILSVVYFSQDKSSLGRIQAWLSTILIIEKNPFLGYGFDTYHLLKYDVMDNFLVDVPHPHNTYLRSIQESGLIGFILYYYLILKAVFYSFNFGKFVIDKDQLKYLEALQLSLVALLIAFNFEPYLSLFGASTLVIWILVSLTFRIRNNAAQEKMKAQFN